MLHKIPSLGPEILTPHPVLVLGTPNARAQGPGASTHILVNMKAIFKKRQARSMCCVPAFIFNVFPLGSLWFTTLTYCGDLHWVFFPHGDCDFFLQWTTASWRTPFTLLPCNFSQCPCAGQRGSSGGALSLGAANQPSEWHQRLERGSWSKVAPNGIEGELLACLEPWFHSIARKELVFLPELNPCTLHPWTHWCVGRSPHRLRPRPKDFSCPKTMDFCFSTTYAWRAAAMRENISSMALWLIPRARWAWGKEQPVRSMKSVADCSCSDVACGPKQFLGILVLSILVPRLGTKIPPKSSEES